MFDLDEDIYNENKIEEIEPNCPGTITVPSKASHDFRTTKLKWSIQHPFRPTTNINPIDKPAHPIVLEIKKGKLALAKLFITLAVCRKSPEPHLTQHDYHIL